MSINLIVHIFEFVIDKQIVWNVKANKDFFFYKEFEHLCNRATGPQGRKPRISGYFSEFLGSFSDFLLNIRFLVKIMWFLSFSSKNDVESFRNFIKIQFLDRNMRNWSKSLTESLLKVYVIFQDLSRRTHKGPYMGP